jgi:hypothetical protein
MLQFIAIVILVIMFLPLIVGIYARLWWVAIPLTILAALGAFS